jgi:hypothetical protein
MCLTLIFWNILIANEGALAVTALIWLAYTMPPMCLRYEKFHIEKLILHKDTIRLKAWRFNKILIDTDKKYPFPEIKIEIKNTAINLAPGGDWELRIYVEGYRIRQFEASGWKKKKFDEILAYYNSYQTQNSPESS